MLAKRLLTVARGLDVVEFGGIRDRTYAPRVRDVFWQRSVCVVGMTWCCSGSGLCVSWA